MWLFRKSPNLNSARTRPVCGDDLTKVSRLLRDGGRHYYGLTGDELPSLLEAGLGAALSADEELLAVAVVGCPVDETCWLRGVALADGIDLRTGLDILIPTLHAQLVDHGVRDVYYAGDEAVDAWLVPALNDYGYVFTTEVIVYEKHDLSIPDFGNPDVHVRSGTSVDIADVLRLDRACFEPQWTKDDTVLGPAIIQGPLFLLAEIDTVMVGYAYATSHFGGRLIHLVRIAVDPSQQGRRIGVGLLAAVIASGTSQGATIITLNTQAYNTHAQRLYRWFGFTPTGERQRVLCHRLSSPHRQTAKQI